MLAIDFEGVTNHFGAPDGWNEARDGKCFTLPVCVAKQGTHRSFTSVWQPTDEERRRIAAGENIALTCFSGQLPVMLTVANIQGKVAPDQQVSNDVSAG